jgi:polyisoprenoid-binding protein YceI
MKRLFPLALLSLIVASAASASTFTVDPSHSQIGFSIRHLVSKVQGKFDDFSGTFTFDAKNPAEFKGTFTAKTASIDTGTAKRDEHLKSGDFFDVQKFPEMTFVASTLKPAGKNKYKLAGDLTMHGVTKPVTFTLEYMGQAKDPWGNERAGFSATGKLNRKDFGLIWNKTLETGGLMVGDEVEVTFNAEAVQDKPAAAAPAAPATH